jgi:L-threonylcarbamoyladenylate synthase
MRRSEPAAGLRDAVRLLRSGGIVAYPTETFYGLGADARNEEALARLAGLKGRPESKPFPLLVTGREQILPFVGEIPETAERLIARFWPGPLTLVLPARGLPASLSNAEGGVGFRASAHPVAAALVAAFGAPITTTSANRTGEPPVGSPDLVAEAFAGDDLLLLDGGIVPGGLPSTVAAFGTGGDPVCLREGKLPWAEVLRALGAKG